VAKVNMYGMCYDRRKVEFSGLMPRRRAGAPAGVMRETGGLLSIAPIRPNLIVALAPILQLFAGVSKRQEPMRVEALRAEAAVERLDEGVDVPMSVKS
jgi:hypothetical protein